VRFWPNGWVIKDMDDGVKVDASSDCEFVMNLIICIIIN
jgi:hypothetical protein